MHVQARSVVSEQGAPPPPAPAWPGDDPAHPATGRPRRTGVTPGLLRIPHLAAFLGANERVLRLGHRGALDRVAGWGLKPSAARARAFAERLGLPFLTLEDGFLRSLDLGVNGAPPLSLVLDDLGIYYDARRPSRLERLIAEGPVDDPALLARARAGIELVRRHRLSKYNAQPPLAPDALGPGDAPLVLVVDQTAHDLSIAAGLASAASFTRMLEAAQDENPGARIVVKTHPDVAAGRRQGHLAEAARARGLAVLARPGEPWSLLERATRVYTVTSQLGLEALLAGLEVRCFGLPFYAGWGLTRDEVACARRGRRRPLEAVFAAAYLLYARYVDPFTGMPTSFEATAATLALWKAKEAADRVPTVALGIARWKRGQVRRFLAATTGAPVFRARPAAALRLAARRGGRLVVWASREPEGLAARAAAAGVPLLRLEDGFLRSAGLGADLVPAASLCLDAQGIYFDPSRTSELEGLIERGGFAPELLARARRLREAIVAHGLSKYNTGKATTGIAWPPGRRRVLIPGQVEDDGSVRRGSPLVRSNRELLRRARAEAPDAFLVYKPHPDVAAGHRRGAVPAAERRVLADLVVGDVATGALLAEVDEVHTMTSLTGFEALLRGCQVVTWGLPFYAGWGLTRDHLACPRRTRKATLDELVAAALILHPRYLDPLTGLPCPVEVVLQRLVERDPRAFAVSWLTRLRRLVGRARLLLAGTVPR